MSLPRNPAASGTTNGNFKKEIYDRTQNNHANHRSRGRPGGARDGGAEVRLRRFIPLCGAVPCLTA